jgi:hypothetical protein
LKQAGFRSRRCGISLGTTEFAAAGRAVMRRAHTTSRVP